MEGLKLKQLHQRVKHLGIEKLHILYLVQSGMLKDGIHYEKVDNKNQYKESAYEYIVKCEELKKDYPYNAQKIASIIGKFIIPVKVNKYIPKEFRKKIGRGSYYNENAVKLIIKRYGKEINEVFPVTITDLRDYGQYRYTLEQLKKQIPIEYRLGNRFTNDAYAFIDRRKQQQIPKNIYADRSWNQLPESEKIKCKNTLGLSEKFYDLVKK